MHEQICKCFLLKRHQRLGKLSDNENIKCVIKFELESLHKIYNVTSSIKQKSTFTIWFTFSLSENSERNRELDISRNRSCNRHFYCMLAKCSIMLCKACMFWRGKNKRKSVIRISYFERRIIFGIRKAKFYISFLEYVFMQNKMFGMYVE